MIAPDQGVRDAVVNVHESFIVSAPAGSGKTALLTLRILELLAIVKKPEEILAITFTRKAAREMQERVIDALHSASANENSHGNSNPHEQKLHEAAKRALENGETQGWNLVSTPGRLKISTIDAFCKQLCNQLPFFSGLGSDANIIDNPEIEYKVVADRWLDSILSSEEDDIASNLLALFHGNLDRLRDMLASLLGIRDQWLPLILSGAANLDQLKEYFEHAVLNWVEETVAPIAMAFAPYEAELLDLAKYAHSNIGDVSKPEPIETLAAYEEFPDTPEALLAFWPAFSEFLTTGNDFRKRVDKRQGFPAGENAEEKKKAKAYKTQFMNILGELQEVGVDASSVADLKKLPNVLYTEQQWRIVETLISALPSLSAYLKLRFTELGEADFTEFSIGAVAALQAQTDDFDLQQRLDYKIQHILIDEFQDTSSLQMELLKALTREWIPDDGKTLFLVGDGMQSCYRFRNANVGIFIRMKQHGLENLQPHAAELNTNFRSTSTIVNWVNSVFSTAFPKQDDINLGAIRYVDSQTINTQEDISSYVKCLGFSSEQDEEANYIANEIHRLRQNFPEQDIAVLVRSRNHTPAIIQALSEKEIPYQAQDIDPLLSKQHVVDIDNLCQYIDNPECKISLLALLRSPFCGLNNADLYWVFDAIRNENNHSSVFERLIQFYESTECKGSVSKIGQSRLIRFISPLRNAFKFYSRSPITQILETTWMHLGGPETLARAADLGDIHRYFELLRSHETHFIIEKREVFEQALAKLYAAPLDEGGKPVQIMTMHKSKGLEFDSVFLLSLHKGKPPQQQSLLNWSERIDQSGEAHFVMSPVSDENESNPLTNFMRFNEAKKSDIEDTRVFYVACTRAKKRLYISGNVKQDDEGKVKAPAPKSLLAKIWATTKDQFEYIDHTLLQQKNDDSVENNNAALRCFPSDWEAPIKQVFSNSARIQAFDNSDYDFFEHWQEPIAYEKELGILFHEILRTATSFGFNDYIQREEAALFSEWTTIHYRLGLDSHFDQNVFSSLLTQLERLEQSPNTRWIVQKYGFEKSEWSLWQRKQDQAKECVIDRVIINNGVCWVIDYKTAKPNDDETIDSFVARERKAYREQLHGYRDLIDAYLKSNTTEKVDKISCALVFTFVPHFEHLPELDIEFAT